MENVISVNKYESINGLRTLACIIIVMFHVKANTVYSIGDYFFNHFLFDFAQMLMFMFMVISGFVMCCGYYDKFIEGKIDIVAFYKRRYMKVLPFFAFLCLLDYVLNPSIKSLYEVFANLTLAFGLIPNSDITVIGVGWFLGVVFAFYFLFPFYCFLLSSKVKACITFVVSYILNYLCIMYFKADRRSIVYCFCFFVAGGIIFLYRSDIKRIKGIKWIALVSAIILTALHSYLPNKVYFTILADCSLLVYAICLEEKNILNNRFTRFIGGISLEIYLSHMVFFRVVEMANLLKISPIDHINYILVVLMVLTGSVIFASIWKKIVSLIIYKIGGE